MIDDKYCPLFTIAASGLKNESAQRCMRDSCAWFVIGCNYYGCSLTLLAMLYDKAEFIAKHS